MCQLRRSPGRCAGVQNQRSVPQDRFLKPASSCKSRRYLQSGCMKPSRVHLPTADLTAAIRFCTTVSFCCLRPSFIPVATIHIPPGHRSTKSPVLSQRAMSVFRPMRSPGLAFYARLGPPMSYVTLASSSLPTATRQAADHPGRAADSQPAQNAETPKVMGRKQWTAGALDSRIQQRHAHLAPGGIALIRQQDVYVMPTFHSSCCAATSTSAIQPIRSASRRNHN